MIRATALGLMGAALSVFLLNCGADDGAAGGAPMGGMGGSMGGSTAGGTGGSSTGGGGGLADAGIDAPPEKEVESSFRSPVATGKYVWAANPESGRVALVDAVTYDVKIAEAGHGPTYLAAIPDGNTNAAIVLNVKSHDATLFRVAADGAFSQKTLKTHTGANAWAVSPGGKWAIAWTDASAMQSPDPTDGFQDVTVIDLAAGTETAKILSVGYRPARIGFASDETRAFAVTEPGISVIDLAADGSSVSALVKVTDDPLDNPAARDVTLTPDGDWALVRRDGSPSVSFVSLKSGTRTDLPLSGNVTDLDLSEDGKRAVAVVRDTSEVFVLPVPGAASDPNSVDKQAIAGELFGSVALSTDASVALLYTNAVASDHLTILKLVPGADYLSHRTVALKAPVSAVFPAPDAQHAIVLQKTAAGSTKAGAFSVVSTVAQLSPKILGTDAAPNAVAIQPAPKSEHALVTVRDDLKKVFGVYRIKLSTQQVDFDKLASPPLATGIVAAANKGYVAQLHPEGRITFIDFASGEVRTLTGFELGAKVVE
ncbi:MAG: hypothetical protein HYZ29_12405 [Myxococcales bacterium]|nr:hypothetical protein [Myxococcales bacterium]